MILSDRTIKEELACGRIVIEPLDTSNIQPSSVDVRLGDDFRIFRNTKYAYIDPTQTQEGLTEHIVASEQEPFILHPGEFALGTVFERIKLPHNIVGRLEGKSSLGRLGLMIHSTAGYVDPGWDGYLTLELSNVSNLPILLKPGMLIGQITFDQMTTEVDIPYGDERINSHYQGQVGATPSRPIK
ncbi:MAG: dCTP deaminase [Coriobacteriia bacterium]|nr:dCTP deaminase [Coriobacteriia bacterium]